jgi:hypothetical protein
MTTAGFFILACIAELRWLGGEELVPGPGTDGVSRWRQQGAVADCPGARYPDRQHPSAVMAGLEVPPEQVRPVAHLGSGHVRRAAGGLAQCQLDEPARHVAGINRLDGEARWHWHHGEHAQLPRVGQAVVVELRDSQDRPGQPGPGHDFLGPELRLRVSPGGDLVDADDGHVHQVRRTALGRGRYEVAGGLGVAPPAGHAVDDGGRRGHGRLDLPAGPQVRGEKRDTRRDGPVVPGEHPDVATAVQQPRDDKLPEAAGAASDKDRRGHEALLTVFSPQEG